MSLPSLAVWLGKACTYRLWPLSDLIWLVPNHLWLLSALIRLDHIISSGPVCYGFYLSLWASFSLDTACSSSFLASFRFDMASPNHLHRSGSIRLALIAPGLFPP